VFIDGVANVPIAELTSKERTDPHGLMIVLKQLFHAFTFELPMTDMNKLDMQKRVTMIQPNDWRHMPTVRRCSMIHDISLSAVSSFKTNGLVT
jgi:hypothetical protein